MAKNRFTLKAHNANDEAILVVLELNVKTMDIEIKTIQTAEMSDAEVDEIAKKWSNGEEISFPDHTVNESRSFTEESLLPDHIKVDGKTGAIRQLQNEWSYLLLNTKLFEQFNTELDELKIKAAELKGFSNELFEESKAFWEKVLEYKKEREISQEKLNYFKEEINGVFDHLKHLKESMMREKDEVSSKIKAEIDEALVHIDAKLDDSKAHFKTLMEDLKGLQAKLRTTDVKREIKNTLFDDIQARFEKVKTKRDELMSGNNSSRLAGLQTVFDRISKSVDLDKRDLDFNLKKLDMVNNKLELQLREAKINVLKDKLASKMEKLADIEKTMKSLNRHATKVKDAVNDKIDETIDKVNEGVKSVKEEVLYKKEEITDKASEIFEETKSKASKLKSETEESISDKAEELKESAKEKAVGFLDSISDAIDEIKEKVEGDHSENKDA